MRLFFVLMLLVVFSSCEKPGSYRPSEKRTLIPEIAKKAAHRIAKDTGLIPCGRGAQAMDQIRMLALSFDYRHEVDIPAGRKLLITALETFLVVINADERIRPHLANYPFEPKNIEIRIFIQNKDGSSVGSGQLCVMGVIDGILDYQIHRHDGCGLDTIHEESYEEALQVLCLSSSV